MHPLLRNWRKTMKKQLTALYFLLFIFLGIIGYACYSLFTMDTEPDTPEAYLEYQDFQNKVTIKETDEAWEDVYLDFDLDELMGINKDFRDWLMIPDTLISFPVVSGPSNYYYLKRDFHKRSSAYGCLFYDVLSVPEAENKVIHGHNMGVRREEMFSTLVQFEDQEYAQAHKFAYLASSPDEPAEIYRLFAVVNFNTQWLSDLDYAQPNFETPEEKAEFINFLQEKSIFETDYVPEGKTLILSTCNREFGGSNRLLLCFGKVAPKEN